MQAIDLRLWLACSPAPRTIAAASGQRAVHHLQVRAGDEVGGRVGQEERRIGQFTRAAHATRWGSAPTFAGKSRDCPIRSAPGPLCKASAPPRRAI